MVKKLKKLEKRIEVLEKQAAAGTATLNLVVIDVNNFPIVSQSDFLEQFEQQLLVTRTRQHFQY